MSILDKVLASSTFVGAIGALIGGTVVLTKNTGELNQIYKNFKDRQNGGAHHKRDSATKARYE